MGIKILILILLILGTEPVFAIKKADQVLVDKSERAMYLMRGGHTFKKYKIALGGNPIGHKQQQGDQRTPEGWYTLDYKKADSAFYKAIHISYPNRKDKARARKKRVKPGGFIMIHGQKNGLGWAAYVTQQFDWTEGCIAVTNAEMDEIWKAIDPGTKIYIYP